VVSIYLLGILALKSANGCGKVPDKAPPFSNIVGGIDFTNSDIEIAAFAVSECRNELSQFGGRYLQRFYVRKLALVGLNDLVKRDPSTNGVYQFRLMFATRCACAHRALAHRKQKGCVPQPRRL